MSLTAFQPNAFQHSAFQIVGAVVPVEEPVVSGGYYPPRKARDTHRKQWRDARERELERIAEAREIYEELVEGIPRPQRRPARPGTPETITAAAVAELPIATRQAIAQAERALSTAMARLAEIDDEEALIMLARLVVN